jgi:hypothetical protein
MIYADFFRENLNKNVEIDMKKTLNCQYCLFFDRPVNKTDTCVFFRKKLKIIDNPWFWTTVVCMIFFAVGFLGLLLSGCDDHHTSYGNQIGQGTETEQLQGTETEQLQGTETEQLQGTESEQLQGTESEQLQGTETEQLQGDSEPFPECAIDGGLKDEIRSNFLMIIENAANTGANGLVLRCSAGSEMETLLQTGNYSEPVRISCALEKQCSDPEQCQCAISMEW